MPCSCVAIDCTNRRQRDGLVSFHRFPGRNKELKEKWIRAIRRENWVPSKESVICSDHFTNDCFTTKPKQKGRFLKKDAMPTIFPTFPSYLHQETPKRKSPKKRKFVEPQSKQKNQVSPRKIARSIHTEHAYMSKETPGVKITKLKKRVEAM